MENETILPVEEMVAYKEFTDRVEILRELDEWVKNIGRMASPSMAIISPRRLGKTVLLDRLVNNVFFKPEHRVAPFYFTMKPEKTTLRKFLLEYATTFFRHYIAYCRQDAVLFRDQAITLEELAEISPQHDAVALAHEMIWKFIRRYTKKDYEDAQSHWNAFIHAPEMLSSFTGIRVAVIIDEFQDMKSYVYDTSNEHFTEMDSRGLLSSRAAMDLTATYRRQSQSRKAPMLVSGSAVTLVFKTVMGGPLGGRFGFKYLRPFSIPDGASLLQTLLPLYAGQNVQIDPENALYASAQVGGHPYYLYCLSVSEFENKRFGAPEEIDALIRYEIEHGKIFGFWQTHFQNNRKLINADSDEELGKKIIYYFTHYNNRPVDIKEIAETLNVSKKAVEKKIERLYEADLVWRTAARYYTFNDICLMRFIKFVYEKDIEDVEAIDLSQRNLINNLKGRFLELVVQVTMMKFNYEILDGTFFGKTGKIEVPRFQLVDTRYVKGTKTRSHQIDVYGREPDSNRIWICECKYTKTKMNISQVRKLEKAADALKQEATETGLAVPNIRMWLVSTGGFTREVLEYVDARDDIFYSDYENLNNIFRAYGGNYDIPIFKPS